MFIGICSWDNFRIIDELLKNKIITGDEGIIGIEPIEV